jgi:hypothetical protein
MWNVRGESAEYTYNTDENTVTSVLRIDRVHRESLGRKLVCEASNIQNTIQLTTSVTMNVYRE